MLLRELRSEGHEVWVYTTSLREPVRLRLWFAALGVRLEGIVNGTRHAVVAAIPYRGQCFELTFDLLRHRLLIDVSDGTEKVLALGAGSVAQFYSAPKGPQRSRAIRLAS